MPAKPAKPVLGGRDKVKVAIAQKSPVFMNLDASVAVSAASFSVSASSTYNSRLRSEQDAYYAVRSSFVPLWMVYIPDPNQPAGAGINLNGQKPHENQVLQTILHRTPPKALTWAGRNNNDNPIVTAGQASTSTTPAPASASPSTTTAAAATSPARSPRPTCSASSAARA